MTGWSTAVFDVFLTSILDGEERSASRSGQFTTGERAPGKHETADYMVRRKLRPLLENECRSSSSVTATLMCRFIKGTLGCGGLKWLWERSNSDDDTYMQRIS